MINTLGYAALGPTAPLAPWTFARRDPGASDVHIRIQFCGICHSDLHTVRDEWGKVAYPMVPGHEIIGQVVAVGASVTRFAVGRTVGVGCLVDSCRTCGSCKAGLEQYCETGATWTYDSHDAHSGQRTQGGYAKDIVVDERYVLRIPDGLDPAAAAPLLCAGITTSSPLREWACGPDTRIGVVGLGGLGHMAVKLARAMGADVTLFTTSRHKVDDATRLGAHQVVLSNAEPEMRSIRNSLDLIIDTVSAPHNLDTKLRLLRRDGTLVLLGGSPEPHPAPSVWPFITGRRRLAGSLIGGIAETQSMLDCCAAHRITSDIELIRADYINAAYDRMLKGDVKYRFVIDAETI